MVMTPLARRIKERLDKLGLNPRSAAVRAGLKEDTIRNVIRGRSVSPRGKTLCAIAEALNWSIEELLGQGNLSNRSYPMTAVPVVSWVEAGSFSEASDPYEPGDSDNEIQVPSTSSTLIALIVRGSSMNRVAPDGSTILVDYSLSDLISGKYYVVKNGGDATFKRYRSNPDRFEPDSTEDHQIIFPKNTITVVGQVVRVIHNL